jgi:hypothetical protein
MKIKGTFEMSFDFKIGDKVKPVDLCQYTLAIDSEVYLQTISNIILLRHFFNIHL